MGAQRRGRTAGCARRDWWRERTHELGEAGQRRKGLGDDRGVVPERRGQHARADLHAGGPLPHRRHPGERERRMPTRVPPRGEVVGYPHAVQPDLLGAHRVLHQVARAELLRRRLVPDPQRHGPALPRSATPRPPSPAPLLHPATGLRTRRRAGRADPTRHHSRGSPIGITTSIPPSSVRRTRSGCLDT